MYNKSLIDFPYAINFVTQGFLLGRVMFFFINKSHTFIEFYQLRHTLGFSMQEVRKKLK